MTKHQKTQKTNAMRILDSAGAPYTYIEFESDAKQTGLEIAHMLGKNPDSMFKTLVTQGKSREYYVFMVPVSQELNLKKAAAAVGEKAISMIPAKELLPLTGYVHGGCSPLGMKKHFRTTADETAQLFDEITFSGGKIGCQITMNPNDLAEVAQIAFADLTGI